MRGMLTPRIRSLRRAIRSRRRSTQETTTDHWPLTPDHWLVVSDQCSVISKSVEVPEDKGGNMRTATILLTLLFAAFTLTIAYAADEAQEAAKPKVRKIDLGGYSEPTGTIGYGEQAAGYESVDDVEGFGDPFDTGSEAPIGKVPSE